MLFSQGLDLELCYLLMLRKKGIVAPSQPSFLSFPNVDAPITHMAFALRSVEGVPCNY